MRSAAGRRDGPRGLVRTALGISLLVFLAADVALGFAASRRRAGAGAGV
ncbi:hypothetical protein ACFWC9_38750 [Streptomyces goshikiensis]